MNEREGSATGNKRPAPFEHVFVATDFSHGAAQAIARAGRLPLAHGGRITIAHVLPERTPPGTVALREKLARGQLDESAKSLSKSILALGRADISVSVELCRGQPYVEIIRHARSVAADLIVLGRHGQRPVKDMFIGSTAERVIRAGDLPVLVVSRKPNRNYRRPAVAVDLEDTCRAVVVAALRVLGSEVASAFMIHAYHVPFEGFSTPLAAPMEMTGLRTEYSRAAASGIEKLKAALGDVGLQWQTSILRGDARNAVLAECERNRADLLVVGTHGRSGLSHALIGSVAEWIIQAAACDVLVARPARVSFELP